MQQESDNITNKICIEYKWVIEEITECGNVVPTTVQETLDLKSEKFSEGKVIDIKEQSGCDEKDEDISEEVTPAKSFIIMELSEIFQNMDTAKGKMLLADPKGGVCKLTKA